MSGSLWFRRLCKDLKSISPHIRIKQIGHGFYRIYWQRAYISEVYREMPQIGYDCTDKDFNFITKKYAEEYEDRSELIRKTKNFVEGYWDSLDRIKTRVYMMRHNSEYNKMATKRYETTVIK